MQIFTCNGENLHLNRTILQYGRAMISLTDFPSSLSIVHHQTQHSSAIAQFTPPIYYT